MKTRGVKETIMHMKSHRATTGLMHVNPHAHHASDTCQPDLQYTMKDKRQDSYLKAAALIRRSAKLQEQAQMTQADARRMRASVKTAIGISKTMRRLRRGPVSGRN